MLASQLRGSWHMGLPLSCVPPTKTNFFLQSNTGYSSYLFKGRRITFREMSHTKCYNFTVLLILN